jgi:hypothetical protein
MSRDEHGSAYPVTTLIGMSASVAYVRGDRRRPDTDVKAESKVADGD